MTVGKDVSTLFTDVINCIQTENLELKKLVYLYLINYAKTQPELALLAVNTFVRDANDPVRCVFLAFNLQVFPHIFSFISSLA